MIRYLHEKKRFFLDLQNPFLLIDDTFQIGSHTHYQEYRAM